jgi:hypothetical protein
MEGAPDGAAIDPRVARILLGWREEMAQSTERALRALRAAGVDDEAARQAVLRMVMGLSRG